MARRCGRSVPLFFLVVDGVMRIVYRGVTIPSFADGDGQTQFVVSLSGQAGQRVGNERTAFRQICRRLQHLR